MLSFFPDSRSTYHDLRMKYSNWLIECGDPRIILYSDESPFYLHGNLNKQRHWAKFNPRRFVARRSTSKTKVLVWAGIFGSTLIGPFFFQGTISSMFNVFSLSHLAGATYLELLTNKVLPVVQRFLPAERSIMYFQQDGAPPHSATYVTRGWLKLQQLMS